MISFNKKKKFFLYSDLNMSDDKMNPNHETIEGDDDDDQLHVEHKIVPTIYNTTTQEPHTQDVPTTAITTAEVFDLFYA